MKINVLLASAQIRGIDQTGGLGDVPVGLARSLSLRGDIDIRLVMPGFEQISCANDDIHDEVEGRFSESNLILTELAVPFGASPETVKVNVYKINIPNLGTSTGIPDVPCYLLRCPEVFDTRDKNSPDKAVFFARATLEFLLAYRKFRVDVIHCNDWHTGLIPVFLRTLYSKDPYLGRIATLYTTHNAEDGFQGAFDNVDQLLTLSGLDRKDMFDYPLQPSLNHYGKFNFCKGAFCFADLVNTVSRYYREELLTLTFGGRLSGVLQQRRAQFCGIINGIDTDEWDPAKDKFIHPHNFSVSDGADCVREQKRKLRDFLRKKTEYKKLRNDSVLVGIVSRIDYQKTEILLEALDAILHIEQDFQLVLLGTADPEDKHGEKHVNELKNIAKSRFDNKLLFCNEFDLSLPHVVFAASEIFLVPSVFEPCGLTPLAAMCYGSVPVVRSVGGLFDSVIDEAESRSATGFRFKENITAAHERMHLPDAAEGFVRALELALETRLYHKDRWNELIINGMKSDWSWATPSMQYVKLYHEAIRISMPHSYFDRDR